MARLQAAAPLKTIRAVDSRYTGFEPVWDGWESWSLDKFLKERGRAFNFYNYYVSPEEGKPAIAAWMKSNGYAESCINSLLAAPGYLPGITVTSLCVSIQRGMPALHPHGQYRSDELFIRERIADAIQNGSRILKAQKIAAEKEQEDALSSGSMAQRVLSPMVMLQLKTRRTIITDLDIMLDDWMSTAAHLSVKPLDIYKAMQGHSLSAIACPQVERWLSKIHAEFSGALNKTDEYLVESYRLYNRSQLQDRTDALAKMLEDVTRYSHAAKAARPPRVKKPAAADKQIAKLKYCKQDNVFKIASINPLRIIGAQRVLAFHTKKRMLLDFVAQSATGLGVKGSGLMNVDEANSKCIRLRKPDEFLQIVLNNTAKQIEKAWNQLTTTEGKPKARINKDIVLLRVFES